MTLNQFATVSKLSHYFDIASSLQDTKVYVTMAGPQHAAYCIVHVFTFMY